MSGYISRSKLIKAVENLQDCYNGFSDTYDKACIIGLIAEQPSVERKRGKWIYQFHEDEVGVTCSECEGYAESFARWVYDEGYRTDYNFCPNCGAEMECADDV